jgi:alkanesulfonate monooxygenase SsuD/methylene tetrahydromethanopterin reductase-like flavin-dependent oxidoreductase (luciferase family)
MQIGLMMRSGNNGGSGAIEALRWEALREMALIAEDVGVDTLAVPDHLLFRHAPPTVVLPEGQTRSAWECFTMLTAYAAITRRVTLLPLVACTSFRNPALLAKIATTLDEVSGGRLLLGLGAGWHEPEYKAYDYPFDHRVSRFEEALQIICPLLRGETVNFSGQYYSVTDCAMYPKGPRPEGPPIWIGARMPRMLGLVAKYAHNYNTDQLLDVDGTGAAEGLLDTVRDACRAIGRDPATLSISSGSHLGLEGWQDVAGGHPRAILHGSTQQIVDFLGAHAELGITHYTFWLHPFTPDSVEALGPIVEAAHKL